MKLKGKAAIITGGPSGIGEASVIAFAREGARVTIVGRSDSGQLVVQKSRAAGGGALFVRADVARAADIDRVFDAHLAEFGHLDVLFNNASYEGPGTPITETSEQEF